MSLSGIVYLPKDELIELHERLIERYGGMPGVRDEGLLDSSLAQPKMNVFGEERFPTLARKAAAYCFFIVCNHPFFDGNKRAGFAAALHFLLLNGAAPVFNEEDAFSTITRVAAGEAGIEELDAMIDAALQS